VRIEKDVMKLLAEAIEMEYILFIKIKELV